MALRRMPFGNSNAPQDGAGMPGAMPQAPGMGGMPGGGGGARPNPQANPMGTGLPPPIDPNAGGPMAPGNIQQMLHANLQPNGQPVGGQPGAPGAPGGGMPQAPPPRVPLPPWGDSHGTPGGVPDASVPMPAGLPGADDEGQEPKGPEETDPAQGAPSQVHLRLLKALGMLPGGK